jgi:hypothetical protein
MAVAPEPVPEPVMALMFAMPVVARLYKKRRQRLWAQTWMMVSLTTVVRQQLPLLPSPSP